jgi:hypothetical protein
MRLFAEEFQRCFKPLSQRFLVLFLVLALVPLPSTAHATLATSVGPNGDSFSVALPNSRTNLVDVLTHPLVITGFPAGDTLRAILTTSVGTLNETSTVGVTAATGYQTPAVSSANASIGLVGTMANLNTALATVQFNAPPSGATATISISVTDSGSGTTVAYTLLMVGIMNIFQLHLPGTKLTMQLRVII